MSTLAKFRRQLTLSNTPMLSSVFLNACERYEVLQQDKYEGAQSDYVKIASTTGVIYELHTWTD